MEHGPKYVYQSMPRLLTLWFETGALVDRDGRGGGAESDDEAGGGGRGGGGAAAAAAASGRKGSARARGAAASARKARGGGGGGGGAADDRRGPLSLLEKTQKRTNNRVMRSHKAIPSYMWYTCLPQLLSRVGHPSKAVRDQLFKILLSVLTAHPLQALWQLGGLLTSGSDTKRTYGERLFNEAHADLVNAKYSDEADAVRSTSPLFQELIKVAALKTEAKTLDIGTVMKLRRIDLTLFTPPTQANLTACMPATRPVGGGDRGGGRGGGEDPRSFDPRNYVSTEPFPLYNGGVLKCTKFHEKADVMNSKAKPKRMMILAENGR